MLLARRCRCARARIFVDDPGHCHRCGYDTGDRLSRASTANLARVMRDISLGRWPIQGQRKEGE